MGWIQWKLAKRMGRRFSLCQNSTNNGNCSSSGNPRIQWDSGIGTEEVLNESFLSRRFRRGGDSPSRRRPHCSGVDRPASEVAASQATSLQPVTVDVAALTPSTARLGLGDPSELVSAPRYCVESRIKCRRAVACNDARSCTFRSLRQRSSLLSGAIINDHAPVYVIKMSGGTFTSRHHPSGGAAPHGAFLTFDHRRINSHRVTDVGYVDNEPDLTKISLASTRGAVVDHIDRGEIRRVRGGTSMPPRN